MNKAQTDHVKADNSRTIMSFGLSQHQEPLLTEPALDLSMDIYEDPLLEQPLLNNNNAIFV